MVSEPAADCRPAKEPNHAVDFRLVAIQLQTPRRMHTARQHRLDGDVERDEKSSGVQQHLVRKTTDAGVSPWLPMTLFTSSM
jgi:hypothetical protein